MSRRPLLKIYSPTHAHIAIEGISSLGRADLSALLLAPTRVLQLKYGTAWPDFIERKWIYHYHHITEGGEGKLFSHIADLLTQLHRDRENMNQFIELPFRVGILCHFLGDAGQPLHLSGSKSFQEDKVHSRFENDVRKLMDLSPRMFDYRPDLTEDLSRFSGPVDVMRWLRDRAALLTRPRYDRIVDAYFCGKGLIDCYPDALDSFRDSCEQVRQVVGFIFSR